MRYKNIICKYCKEPATVTTLRKNDYCDKEDCRLLAHNEASKNCYSKNISKSKVKTNEVIVENATSNKDIQIVSNMPKIDIQPVVAKKVTERKVSTEAVDSMYIADILEFARKYDDLRYEGIKLIQKEVAKEKGYNKTGDMLLHMLEFEDISAERWASLREPVTSDRVDRRRTKIRRQIYNEFIENMPIRSAKDFVRLALEGARTTRDFDKYLVGLRDNERLFAKKREKNNDKLYAKKREKKGGRQWEV